MDPTAAALAEEQTDQVEAASEAAVEIASIKQEAITEREELYQDGATERAQIEADAAVAMAEAQAESGVDEEWLRSQFDALNQRSETNAAAMLALTEAISNLATLLAPPSLREPPLIPTLVEEPPPPPPQSPSEPTVEPAPAPVASAAKTRRTVLF